MNSRKLRPVSLEKHFKNRGRYTKRRFWEYIGILKRINKSKQHPIFKSEKMPVASKSQYFKGFLSMYPWDAFQTMREGEVC